MIFTKIILNAKGLATVIVKKMSRIIRNVEIEDAGRIAQIYKYYVDNTAISFELEAPGEEEMANRIRKVTKTYPFIVLEEDGVVVGYAYGSTFRERIAFRFTTEISVYVANDMCSKGYGKLLTNELLDELKACGFYVAISCITTSNSSSIKFFEAYGFKHCATYENCGYKNNEWHSVMMSSLNLQDEFLTIPKETTKCECS